MKSIKCPQCGLTNWETSEWCKRCKLILKGNGQKFSNQNESSQSNFANGQTMSSEENSDKQSSQSRPNTYAGADYKSYRRTTHYDFKNGFLAKNIERCKRNLMIVCILTIVVVLCGFFLNFRYLTNVVLGPSAIDQDKLLYSTGLQNDFRSFVKVNAEEVYDTGGTYYEVSKYNVQTVKSKYYVLQIKDKLLLAEVEPNTPIIDGAKNVIMSGEIANIPSDVSSKIVEPILREQPEIRSSFLPYILKTKSDIYYPAYIGTAIGLILLLIAGISLWSVLKKLGDPLNSSIMETLKSYGSNLEVAASIDAEIAGQHDKIGSIHLLPTWIIKNNTFSISVQHVEEIVWMYKKVTKHSVNFIPTGKTYEVVLHNSKGNVINLNGTFLSDQKTNQMLENIYQKVPWIVTGFDNELLSYWNSDKNSFVQSVKARQKSFLDQLNKTEEPETQTV